MSFPQPVFLFADSQLLFWKADGVYLINWIARQIPASAPKAAYLGASNNCQPEFFQLFQSALQFTQIVECRPLPLHPSPNELNFLQMADLILLAGGDVHRGWENFTKTGITEILQQRYRQGAVFIGISAGAIQLGLAGWTHNSQTEGEIFNTLQIVPVLIDAHAENENWNQLQQVLRAKKECSRGIGIPSGGGLIFYPDGRVTALRFPAIHFLKTGREILRQEIQVELLMINGE